jgi:hypothetical protein
MAKMLKDGQSKSNHRGGRMVHPDLLNTWVEILANLFTQSSSDVAWYYLNTLYFTMINDDIAVG